MNTMEYDTRKTEENFQESYINTRHDTIYLFSVIIGIATLISLGFAGLLP
ncbi:MAG: hypothetical protein WJ289_06125 [Ferrovum myxofaciens]|nr:hypothetical protein [Ferrovum myxofaciens]QWY75107.1 MAG: hypothetical protein JVY19_01265 [Ferrovum myxofaciens]